MFIWKRYIQSDKPSRYDQTKNKFAIDMDLNYQYLLPTNGFKNQVGSQQMYRQLMNIRIRYSDPHLRNHPVRVIAIVVVPITL